ncbi:hypothetical protein JW926_10705 [Candidatus Sumerlaeota bacterium]|nr:hypothetical protein [Candidatus Sumerlaeota bacterium]
MSFPSALVKYGRGAEDSVKVVPYSQFNLDDILLEGIAKTECGRGCLFIQANPSARFIRVVSKNKLDRTTIKGKAIVQADFYVKERSPQMLGIALLATEIDPRTPDIVSAFYRLGINPMGEVYFSYYDSQLENKVTNYYKDDMSYYQLKTPGWHRFQMVFTGPETIHCFVDGIQSSYSPIREGSLKNLQMGVMIAAQANQTANSLIDNLSIQIADEELPLPSSPWTKNITKTTASPLESNVPHVPAVSSSAIHWYTTPEEAVLSNIHNKRQYLILFYSPFVKTNASLNQIIMSDINAQNYLKQFVLVCIDVNQLGGGALAQSFEIYKVPCFLILNYEGNEVAKSYFVNEMDWSRIYQDLQKSKP